MKTTTTAMAILGLLALSACGEDTTASDGGAQRNAEAKTEATPQTAAAVQEAPPAKTAQAEAEPEPEPIDAVIAFKGEDGEMELARESLTMISPVHDSEGDRWSVFVQLDKTAAEDFYDLTTRTSGEALSVIVDEMIVSAPVLDTPIYGGGFVFPVDDGDVAGKVVAALTGKKAVTHAPHVVDAKEALPDDSEETDAVAEVEADEE